MTTTLPLLNWLLGSTLALGLLWLPYRLALRSERCFGFNRAYLVLAPWLALALPLLHLGLPGWLAAPAAGRASVLLPAGWAAGQPAGAAAGFGNGWLPLNTALWLLYGAGAAFFGGVFLLRMGRLWRLVRRWPRQRRPGYVLVLTGGRLPVSSFGRWIFWDETAGWPAAEARQVLAHEVAHVRQHHTRDQLAASLSQIVLWFNPFSHLFARALRLNHEFLADAAVSATAPANRPADYAALLARHAADGLLRRGRGVPPALLHSYFHSPILTRIAMLETVLPVRRWKQALVLPAVVAALLLVAERPAQAQPRPQARQQTPPSPPAPGPAAHPVLTAEQRPEYPGGLGQFMQDLQAAIVYPPEAEKAKLEGRVFASFVVGTDGRIYEVALAAPMKAPAEQAPAARALEAETLRALRTLSKTWTPGRDGGSPVAVSFTLPVGFVLADE